MMKLRPALENLKGKKDLVGAEIGVSRAENAESMIQHLDIKKLYLIDPYQMYRVEKSMKEYMFLEGSGFKGENVAKRRLGKYEDKIELVWLKTISRFAVDNIGDGELDFIYIDGNHYYREVKSDMKLYWPKVKIGGLFSGHDYNRKAVKDAVNDILGKENVMAKKGAHYIPDWWIIKKTEKL